MGLFRKNKDIEPTPEDFILDFEPGMPPAPLKNEVSESLSEEDDVTLPSWNKNKSNRDSHAMTVDEILGIAEEESNSSLAAVEDEDGKMRPKEQILPEDLGAEKVSSEEEVIETIQEIPLRKESISLPETEKAEITAEENFEEEKEETTNLFEDVFEDGDGENITEKEVEIEAEEKEQDPPQQSIDTVVEEPKPLEETATQETAQETVEPGKKNQTSLSPAAQAIYDRMMAQRARRQAAEKSVPTIETPISDEIFTPSIPSVSAEAELNAEEVSDNEDSISTDITPAPTQKVSDPFQDEEKIADSIFSSLKESLKEENPLIKRVTTQNGSLLSKVKNYVTTTSEDISEDSIDSIIHNAEQGARERLNNLYGIQESEKPLEHTASFDASLFIRDKSALSTEEAERSVSVPVKIIDETSDKAVISSSTGDIKNFQFSFADSSAHEEEVYSTKTIDIPSEASPSHTRPHTDTAKIEAIRMHLNAMADETVEDFEEDRPHKVKFTGLDETQSDDEELFEEKEAPQMDDYTCYEDRAGIKTDLSSKRISLMARLIPTAIIFAVLAILDFGFKDTLIAMMGTGFAVINLCLLTLAMVINLNTLKGISSIFFGNPDMDSPAAIGVVLSFLSSLVVLLIGSSAQTPPLAPIATFVMLSNIMGKLTILSRIERGFKVIATPNKKRAVCFTEDKLDAAVMANGAVIGEALIVKGKETLNVKDFLKNSYSEDLYEKRLKTILIWTLSIAGVFGILGAVFSGGISGAFTALAAVTLIACPPSALLFGNMPLSIVQKKLSSYGAMLAGHDAAEAISNANAVVFSATELFPEGTVKLYNMHVLNKGAVDKYLTYAASVLKEAGSPLCPIFNEMLLESNQDSPKADSVKFENQMGVSGWIGEHRVFIGNRTLMEGHSIKVPSLELDRKILREGYFPVYLAFDQQLCALFIVGYEAEETITYELRRLCNTGVTMLVETNDPNISEEMLCDYFGLYPDSIKVLTPSGVSAYKKGTAYQESVSAPAAFGSDICGFLAIVTSAIRVKALTSILFIMNIIGVCITLATAFYMILSGMISVLGIGIFLAQLILTALTSIVAHLYQP